MLKGSRNAFTMIELIFIIVIIGILAAIAVPKLAENSDDATASVCTQEVNQLIVDIASAYVASHSFSNWKEYRLESNITNLNTNIRDSGNGLENNANDLVYGTTLVYRCDGAAIIDIKTEYNNSHYAVVATLRDADTIDSMAARKAREKLHQIFGDEKKIQIM